MVKFLFSSSSNKIIVTVIGAIIAEIHRCGVENKVPTTRTKKLMSCLLCRRKSNIPER